MMKFLYDDSWRVILAFIKFTDTGKSFASKASISPRGMLSFSDGARRKFKIDEYTHGVLYYDKETNLVGIELTRDTETDGAIKIRLRQTGADMGVKSFIDFFGIAPEVTSMYELIAGDQENWMVVDLKTARERKVKQGAEDDLSDLN